MARVAQTSVNKLRYSIECPPRLTALSGWARADFFIIEHGAFHVLLADDIVRKGKWRWRQNCNQKCSFDGKLAVMQSRKWDAFCLAALLTHMRAGRYIFIIFNVSVFLHCCLCLPHLAPHTTPHARAWTGTHALFLSFCCCCCCICRLCSLSHQTLIHTHIHIHKHISYTHTRTHIRMLMLSGL